MNLTFGTETLLKLLFNRFQTKPFVLTDQKAINSKCLRSAVKHSYLEEDVMKPCFNVKLALSIVCGIESKERR